MEKKIINKDTTFEAALAELEEIVNKIDKGQETLESAIDSFERGILLKSYCEKKLQEARLKIEKITLSTDSEVVIEKVDLIN